MVGERTTLGSTLLAPPPSARERMVRLRLMLVTLSACFWVLVIMVRLVQLQVLGRAFFERQAARQSERTINLDPRRGAIVDRNGHPLAVSVDARRVQLWNMAEVRRQLSELGVDWGQDRSEVATPKR